MEHETKRIRINKVMVAWSDGRKVNLPPSVRREVDDYGKTLREYLSDVDEGYEMSCSGCAVARGRSRCSEYEADRYWEQGSHLEALKEMMRAALASLPDDEPEFEDVQWLDPEETVYWHPNVKEFVRLANRCRELCRRDPRLWPIYNGSTVDDDYRTYLDNLRHWRQT